MAIIKDPLEKMQTVLIGTLIAVSPPLWIAFALREISNLIEKHSEHKKENKTKTHKFSIFHHKKHTELNKTGMDQNQQSYQGPK